MIEIIPNWHPIFVHYTVALLSISTVLFIATFFFPGFKYKEQLITAARWNLWIGGLITVVTLAAGMQAYNTVAHDTASHTAMTNHRNWAIPTAILFFLLCFWQIRQRSHKNISLIFVVSITCASLLLVTTAYKGGELVYRYGLGVQSLPTIEKHGSSGQDRNTLHKSTTKGPIDADSSAPMSDKPTNGHDHEH